jgi:tetratricopeptide (TPR) repeat protein
MDRVAEFLLGIFVVVALSSPSFAQQDNPRDECIDPRSPEMAISCGNKRVIAAMTDIISRDPNNEIPYYLRGLAFLRLSDFDHAIEDASSMIRIAPHVAAGYKLRALAYYWQHKTLEGFHDIQRTIELDPTYAEAYVIRAYLYESALHDQGSALRKHYCTLAEVDFKKALELKPNLEESARGLQQLREHWCEGLTE